MTGTRRDRHRATGDSHRWRRGTGEGDAWIGGRRAVAEAVRAGRALEVLVAEGARAAGGLGEALEAADRSGIPVREVDRDELEALAPHHHGVAARVRLQAGVGERDLAAWPFPEDALVVVLDGITDPQNLGAAARGADAAGAAMLVSRIRRAAGITPASVRASAGALIHIPHARVANLGRALDRLKEAGFHVVGLDASAGGTIYESVCPPGRLALVVGSEGRGMSRLVREACDELVSLPMHGHVESLNAAAALAAALYGYVLPARTRSRGA